MALGINQIAAIAGSFLGLVLGGLLAAFDWRAVFWVNVPFGMIGTIWSYLKLREHRRSARGAHRLGGQHHLRARRGLLLAAITYGIQPYGGHPTGWTNPGRRRAGIGGVAAGRVSA